MAKDLGKLFIELARKQIDFKQLLEQFEDMPVVKREATKGDWGKVYSKAEEISEDTVSQIDSAHTARIITATQRERLLSIYSKKVAA